MLQADFKSVLLLVLLCCSHQACAEDDPPSSVRDLQYGEMLFYYYQQDYFNSIIRLEIAQQQERLPNHKDEAELMHGGLVLSYGMRNAARHIFQQLLDDDRNNLSVHNRAWLYLARISYQRGDLDGALDAITHIKGRMTPATRTATANLHSLLLMAEGRNKEAIALLEGTRSGKYWTPYLKYNLGVAQIRNGEGEAGTATLESIGKTAGGPSEQHLLRDKANLALGYSLLQQGETEKSGQSLEKVRLEGPFSNKALLGAGWAYAQAGRFEQALVPWIELSTRDIADPAVQEALLAVPYAMAQMKLFGQAIGYYKEGIAALHDEQSQLDLSIDAVRGGELLKQLEQDNTGTGYGWLQQLDLDADSPVLRYQTGLMASHDFQEAVKNYRDLLFLRGNLEEWSESIAAYDDMLATRQRRYYSHLPAAEHVLAGNTRKILQQRYAALADIVTAVEATGNSTRLANTAETQQLQSLSAIEVQLAALPDSQETRDLRDKQNFLFGILYWQINSEYKQRLWQTKQQLSDLEIMINQTGETTGSLEQAGIATPVGFNGFEKRISGHETAIGSLHARTAEASRAQGILIEQLAVNELENRKIRIDSYIVQARFALAQTYDSSLNKLTDGVLQ